MMKEILEAAALIAQSPFALVMVLIISNAVQFIWTKRQLAKSHNELRAAVIECRRDGLTDVGFLRTSMNINFEYRTLLVTALGGRREPPTGLKKIDEHFDSLRRRVHDEETSRKVRMDRTLERATTKAEEEGE